MNDRLLDKADALIQRRSAADEQAENAASVESSGYTDTDDFPLLTEVVGEIPQQPPVTGEITHPAAEISATQPIPATLQKEVERLLMERQALLTAEIETWLDEQMPQLVIRAMDGITDHLVALLANRARDELLPRLEAVMQQAANEKPDSSTSE